VHRARVVRLTTSGAYWKERRRVGGEQKENGRVGG
jgi:hypothetical protein